MFRKLFAISLCVLTLLTGCSKLPPSISSGTRKTDVAPVEPVERIVSGSDSEMPMVEFEPREPDYDIMNKGFMRYPHSAWKHIEKTCYILNPIAGATTGSKTIYSLPGYDYDITLERVLEKGTSGGFCCAGFISWMFYNILVKDGYGEYTDKLITFDDSAYTYKAVLFYHDQNDHELREITLDEAEIGDLIVYGGQRNDHQHVVFYAGKDENGNALVWHSGQDGVGRMRADRMRTNGVLNYIAHVYSYFEPPVKLDIRVVKDGASVSGAVVKAEGPLDYSETFTSDENGMIELRGLDIGNYTLHLIDSEGRIIQTKYILLDEAYKDTPRTVEMIDYTD